MLWLALAVGAQTSGALAIHLDKIALDNYVRGFQTTFVLAALVNGLTAVVCLAAVGLPSLSARDVAFGLISGALFIGHLLLYLIALQRYSALSAAVFFQLTPGLGVALAAAANDSSLTVLSLVAITVICAGAVCFSVLSPDDEPPADGTPAVSFGVLRFMLPCTLALAGSAFLLDRMHSDTSVIDAVFVSSAGSFAFGLIVAMPVGWIGSSARDLGGLPMAAWPSVGGAEILAVGYQWLILGALLSGPVAFVLAIEGVQPMILLIIGVLLSFAVPHLVVARPGRRRLVALAACSAAILGGVALLAVEST
jgi:hypothetical protein